MNICKNIKPLGFPFGIVDKQRLEIDEPRYHITFKNHEFDKY